MASRREVSEILEGAEFTMKHRRTDSGWWIAYCEEVPEARTHGASKEEVGENLKDAISLLLEDYSSEELKDFRDELASEERELLALWKRACGYEQFPAAASFC